MECVIRNTTNNMEKKQLLKTYGESRVKDIAGILHNYTKDDSLNSHDNLETILRKLGNARFKDSIGKLEEVLEFY